MSISRRTYNLLRSVVVTTLVTIVAAFALLYLFLLLPPLQQRLCQKGEKALSEYLNTTVDIGSVSITPFNQLELNNVLVNDQQGDSLLMIDKLGAGISLKDLIANRRIVITYGEIIGLNGHVTRPDKSSPTNMQFIIDAFKPKEDKPPKPFDVQVNTVVVRKSSISYDVLDQPCKPGAFDVNHLNVKNLRADLSLPQLRNNDFDIRVKRLSFDEGSGFTLSRFSTDVHITDNTLDVKNISVKLPNSDIHLDDIQLKYSSLKNLGSEIAQKPITVSTPGSVVTFSDLGAFVPQFRQLNQPFRISTTVVRDGQRIEVPVLSLRSKDEGLSLYAHGGVTLPTSGGYHSLSLDRIDLDANANSIAKVVSLVPGLTPEARSLISRCGNVAIDGELHTTPSVINFNGDVGTSLGRANLNGTLTQQQGASRFSGQVKTDGLRLGTLLDKQGLIDDVAMDAHIDAVMKNKDISGHLQGHISHVDFKGIRYHDINADIDKQGNQFTGSLAMNDPNGRVHVDGQALLDGVNSTYDVNIVTEDLNLLRLGLTNKYPDHRLAAKASASFWGNSLDNITGHVQLNDVAFTDAKGEGLRINNLQLDSDNNDDYEKVINVVSDHVSGYIEGEFDFKTIVPTIKHMLARTFPLYFEDYAPYTHAGPANDVTFDFTVHPDDDLNRMLNLPVYPFFSYTVKGGLSESNNTFDMTLDAPFMRQGNKIITGTHLVASLDSLTNEVKLEARSSYPVKNGKKVDLNLMAIGLDNRINANLGWRVQGDTTLENLGDFHGDFNLCTLLNRSDHGKLNAEIDVNPSIMVINDTIWNIAKGHIDIDDGTVTVNNVAGSHAQQLIRINGKASHDPDDEICLELNDVNLDYVFETLAIDHVAFGGRATSKVFAGDLFSGTPRLYTPSLFIKDISYNQALMGDIDIKANFDNESKGIIVSGDIAQRNGRHSTLDGGIYVADDSLDILFKTDHANAAFLKPYMEAFTADVQGEMSGDARLFGNFHTINLEGDLHVDTMRFLIDFVNCYYTASDVDIHVIPDLIEFEDIPIHDKEGHEAHLGGWLKHDAFHRPEFNFGITGARDFLCYDTNPAINPRWYGTVYGNGSCFVDGGPGIVNIRVNMVSAPRSKFTFVMSDDEQAETYDFITFRDRNAPVAPVLKEDTTSLKWVFSKLNQFRAPQQQEENAEPSAYNIDLQGEITPDVAVTVIMDPKGGDRIKATGHGHMRLTYNNNDEMMMYGKYTLDKGTYNFTLQDVIIRDFTIEEGSSITFSGDPYRATLDLEAVYQLNANLKDLHESFSDDKELNRTSVPVQALLRANGIISQPDISFDLKFPSLSNDVYRKVKSIISTDEMMSRQIIYLLALNRFYTPEFTDLTTHQNELISSVASSTLSSQMSNILGKMSENLSIAPNFRTDKGDFSDFEVDVALSSQLLNNRLLINGNLGYRENPYNTSSTDNTSNTNFIGDFDIEYLLNGKGTFRLKAYNHFNDQRLREALTTQGVGIVWKHDFDRLFHKKNNLDSVAPDLDTIPKRELPAGHGDSSVNKPVPIVTFRQSQREPNTSTSSK